MPGDAYSEAQGLIRGRGYIPKEMRPPEEVEEEEKEKGPSAKWGSKYVPLEERPAPDSNPEENLIRKEEGEEAAEGALARLEKEEEVAEAQWLEEDERKERRRSEQIAGWSPRRVGPASKQGEQERISEVLAEKFEGEQKGEKLTREERLWLAKEKRSARGPLPGERPAQKPRYKTEHREAA